MARKKKAEEPKVVVVPEAKAEVTKPVSFGKCKSCGSELKKLLYDSRAKNPLYLYVCDNKDCPLYRQPQKYDGDLGGLPQGVNLAIT